MNYIKIIGKGTFSSVYLCKKNIKIEQWKTYFFNKEKLLKIKFKKE